MRDEQQEKAIFEAGIVGASTINPNGDRVVIFTKSPIGEPSRASEGIVFDRMRREWRWIRGGEPVYFEGFLFDVDREIFVVDSRSTSTASTLTASEIEFGRKIAGSRETTSAKTVDSGHGHVRQRADGVRMRCGGPKICSVCALEFARLSESVKLDLGDLAKASAEDSHSSDEIPYLPGSSPIVFDETPGARPSFEVFIDTTRLPRIPPDLARKFAEGKETPIVFEKCFGVSTDVDRMIRNPRPKAGEVIFEIMESIKKEKVELDSEILAAIQKFEEKVGLEVQSIDVDRIQACSAKAKTRGAIVRTSVGLRELL